jgi:hypothetical protein
VGFEGLCDQRAVKRDVMVAQDGITKGSCKGGEDLRATADSMASGDKGEGSVGYEVACEQDEIGRERVDLAYDPLQKEGFGVLVQVNIAELDDAISVKRGG